MDLLNWVPLRLFVYCALAFLTNIYGDVTNDRFDNGTIIAGLIAVCIAFNAFRTNANPPAPAIVTPPPHTEAIQP